MSAAESESNLVDEFLKIAQTDTPLWLLVVLVLATIAVAMLVNWGVGHKTKRGRPIYWNLVIFALIGALFSFVAIIMVDAEHRNGIALLYLGMLAGYGSSIKETDIEKLKTDISKLKILKDANEKEKLKDLVDED